MFTSTVIHKTLSALVVLAALAWPTICQSEDFEIITPSETSLELIDGEIQANLNQNGCVVGFEAACSTVLQRSEYVSTTSHAHGDRVIYGWDIMVPESFTYNASGGYLRAARFLNRNEESVLSFLLDGKIGYDVGREVCFDPDGFGAWHTIEVRVVWDSTPKKGLRDKTPGEMHVFCDGTEVLLRSGRPTLGEGDEIRLALGLAGSLNLADGDSAAVSFRNVRIETW